MEKRYFIIKNASGAIMLTDIPVLDYQAFCRQVAELLLEDSSHCVMYYAVPLDDNYRFICCIADDIAGNVMVFSHEQPRVKDLEIDSIAERHFPFHIFEREIHENYGIVFRGHPWMKPVRFPHDKADPLNIMDNYPFYSMESNQLHEVGVGPVHAGVIEPGHFRFVCHGEKVLHLEIQLGYQHRGIERLFVEKGSGLQRAIIAESIAGDSASGHALCHAGLMETQGQIDIPLQLHLERTVALELERIAMHIGDTAALCTDVAYQFGQVVNEALRTMVINTTQLWCGNRFSKGLIRPGGSHYPLTENIKQAILANLKDVKERYIQITDKIFSLPSVLGRFEGIGKVSLKQAQLIGAVGMAARSSGLMRDIRSSHPFGAFKEIEYEAVVLHKGDVWSRAMLRKIEVEKSIELIIELLSKANFNQAAEPPDLRIDLQPSSFVLSMTEGWRGEICHSAITDKSGKIIHYKVKDPSFHNWMALALAVRNQEISDFPLCNKSFNLSYCGNDL